VRVVGGGTTRDITDLNLPVLCEGEGGGRRDD
jgi:hypothetical protein